MSAAIDGIGPVSVRYAVQIRELLYSQAMQRMAAEQEAARVASAAAKNAQLHPKVEDAQPAQASSVDLTPSLNDAPPASSSANNGSSDSAAAAAAPQSAAPQAASPSQSKSAVAQVVDILA